MTCQMCSPVFVAERKIMQGQTRAKRTSILHSAHGSLAGGETVFPLEGEDGFEVLKHIDYRSCKDGFKVKDYILQSFLQQAFLVSLLTRQIIGEAKSDARYSKPVCVNLLSTRDRQSALSDILSCAVPSEERGCSDVHEHSPQWNI